MPNQIIYKIKFLAFFLFFSASVAIIGSLLINNHLVSFNYSYQSDLSKNLTGEPGSFYEESCDDTNEYCASTDFLNYWEKDKNRLDDCFKYGVEQKRFVIDNQIYFKEDIYTKDSSYKILKKQFANKDIKIRTFVSDNLNPFCITFSESYKFYKIFPTFYELTAKIKNNNLSLASSYKINPFFYGETSISNLVKRYPINYFFKSFLYLSVLLMLFYWINYNKFFSKKLNKPKNTFFYLGICSAIFLFFHVLFLGWDLDSELFKKLRRLIIVLFILFELLAQVFLTKDLYKNKKSLYDLCYFKIILVKVYFVTTICIGSLIIILGLMFFNYPSSVDYILEWNYFVILLIFYFLSSIMWKRVI